MSLDELYNQPGITPKAVWKCLSPASGYSKKALREELLKEQGYLCCYCNRRIELKSEEEAKASTIEHFLPRSAYLHLTFEYSNLHAACSGKVKPQERPKKQQNCGQKKDDEKLPLSPLSEDIEQHFGCTKDGQIMPKTEVAEETIHLLNLNAKKLKDLRQSFIEANIYTEETVFEDVEEFIDEAAAQRLYDQLSQKRDGKYDSFCHQIQQVLQKEILENA